MAVYSQINEKDLILFLAEYEIGSLINYEGILEGIENTNYKITTSQNKYILTIFEKRTNTEDLPFFINLKNHLAKKKFKCPTPIKNKKGSNMGKINGKTCVLISFLDGEKKNNITENICNEVGEVLSKLHNETKDFNETRENSMNYNQWEVIFSKCKLSSSGAYSYLMPIIEKELSYLKNNWPKNLPKGIIHADVFKDNVFFKNNKFSGLIDFYFSCNDYLAYDIALTINAWCFDKKIKFEINKFQSMINGYEINRKLESDEKKNLSILSRGASIRILLTRLHDMLFQEQEAFVELKDPIEYLNILKFHQENDLEKKIL